MSSHSKPKYNSNQNTLNYRLQRIATSLFVAGVAGTVAGSRMMRSLDNASNGLRVTQSSPSYFVPANTSSHERADKAAANLLHTGNFSMSWFSKYEMLL